jgi:hypothetical protein
VQTSSFEQTEKQKQWEEWEADEERRRKIEQEIVPVRCTVDRKEYEVRFHGARPWEVLGVYQGSRNGRKVELKFRHWHATHFHSPRDLDARVVEAARRELNGNGEERARRLNREARLARLQVRQAQLLREIEKVEAAMAIMQREVKP